mgnify:CR=1 FL=1
MSYLEFQIELAIRLSLQVYHEPSYLVWAHKWLDGSDRAADSAYASAADSASAYASAYDSASAADSAYADASAADAAASAAAYAAADAAAAAAYAAADTAYAADDTAYAADDSIKISIRLGAKLEAVVKFI